MPTLGNSIWEVSPVFSRWGGQLSFPPLQPALHRPLHDPVNLVPTELHQADAETQFRLL
jgi:hypothetical protein